MDYEYEKVIFNKENERHVEMAREYCDEHEFFYKNHTVNQLGMKMVIWIYILLLYTRIKK